MDIDRNKLKFDKGKPDPTLILPGFLIEMAEVLTTGKVNHPPVNGIPSWQHLETEALRAAMQRHYLQKELDPNSRNMDMFPDGTGSSHYINIAVNAMFLWWHEQNKEILNAKPKELIKIG